jgi:rod shape determining protein RodA
MRGEGRLSDNIDWSVIFIYMALVIFGWLNIYAAVYDVENPISIFSFSLNSGKQLVWIGISILFALLIFSLDFRFFRTFSWTIFAIIMLSLVAVLLLGTEVAGSKSWIQIGSVRIQPSEFAKYSSALALATYLHRSSFSFNKLKDLFIIGLIILGPMALTILQGDTGSALVYTAFILVLFREGMSPLILIFGVITAVLFILTLLITKTIIISALVILSIVAILFCLKELRRILIIILALIYSIGMVVSVDYVFKTVLKPHQQNRISVFINPNSDPMGAGWQVTQSKIAIGSGGFWGKGYLQGTQTKFDFIPDQSTDNIFCTVGEEHGFIGSLLLVVLFVFFLIKLVQVSERQKSRFARAYGYSVTSIFLFHVVVNIGMTIGLFPVIGIPLPFFSYGGSALVAFTILLFTLLKLDAHRMQILGR